MTPQPPRSVDLFVSGRWQPPRAGQYEPATSPVTGELIGHVAQGDRADAGAAVQAAADALGKWAAATSIYTADAGTGLRYADAVRAAWVNINESSNYWETHLPFGGGGGGVSGVGRVGGRYAMEALSQVRTVVLSGLS
jgi:acyl-CoA reductase-like NAD-dependent aldehyde dehydrogenase